MNTVDMLNQIRTLLGVEQKVELAQMTLDNGTVLEAEAFEADNEVFIVTEEEKIALPVGEYTLEDGRMLMVEEEGIIKEVKTAEEPAEEVAEEVEAEEEVAEEEMAYVTRQEFGEAMDEIKAMIEELGYGKKEEEMQEEVKENLASQEPAEQPLRHNPEQKTRKAVKKFSQNRRPSTTDVVFNKLFNK